MLTLIDEIKRYHDDIRILTPINKGCNHPAIFLKSSLPIPIKTKIKVKRSAIERIKP